MNDESKFNLFGNYIAFVIQKAPDWISCTYAQLKKRKRLSNDGGVFLYDYIDKTIEHHVYNDTLEDRILPFTWK